MPEARDFLKGPSDPLENEVLMLAITRDVGRGSGEDIGTGEWDAG